MSLLLTLLLVVASASLVWLARPRSQNINPDSSPDSSNSAWSGESAARFAAGLVIVIYALLAPFNSSELHSVQLLMQQLSAFAALPLLFAVSVALFIRKPLSRMMWGRILLGWCVVFELLRHNNLLDQYLLVLCATAVILALPTLFYCRDKLSYCSVLVWFLLSLLLFIQT